MSVCEKWAARYTGQPANHSSAGAVELTGTVSDFGSEPRVTFALESSSGGRAIAPVPIAEAHAIRTGP